MEKRLAVLVTVPIKKQVPEYVYYLADKVSRLEGDFYIAVNGEVSKKSLDRLQGTGGKVVLRRNEDYDIGAYREIVLGQANGISLDGYGELLLLNDSFYGPIYPLEEVFEKMEGADVDFWGLCAHPKTVVRNKHIIECHLQSYFLVVRQRMLHSREFRQFWDMLPSRIPSRELAIESFEKKFTPYFAGLGYTWDSYVDTSRFTSSCLHLNYNPYAYSSLEMIETYRFPVLKRGIVPLKNMEHFANWDDAAKCLEFIEKKTAYPAGYIWDDLLQRYDVNLLKNYLHLNYIVSPDGAVALNTNGMGAEGSVFNEKIEKNVLIIINGMDWGGQFPESVIKVCDVIMGGALSRLSRDYLSKYEYICFLDLQGVPDEGCYCVKKTMLQNLVENLLKDGNYIQNVAGVFQQHPRIGVLFVMDAYLSEIFSSRKESWRCAGYTQIKGLTEKEGYRCIVSKEWMPETGTGSFWCRAGIFRGHKGWGLLMEVLKGMEGRILGIPYLAQHYGYLTGEILSSQCVPERLAGYQYALSALTDAAIGIHAENLHDYHIRFCQGQMRPQVVAFCSKYQYIYIYGAGVYGEIFAQLLEEEGVAYHGFIISRGQYKGRGLCGHPISYLDEIHRDAGQTGILVAVPPPIQPAIRDACRVQGYCNLYCFEARIANK